MLQDSLRDYPWAWAAAGAAVLLCALLWYKAMQAAKRRSVKKAALIAQLDYEKALREEFQSIDQNLLIQTPPARLIEGLCCHIQMQLERQPDLGAAFAALPQPQRWIYALGYLIQDSKGEASILLSDFFRKNGEPLLTAAMEAVQMLLGGEFAEIFNAEFAAFDSENEEISLLNDDILLLDARFYGLFLDHEAGADEVYAEVKEYILANSAVFHA